MEDERAIAAGAGVDVVVGGANAELLRARLAQVDTAKIGAIYSFGVAGGLDGALPPGTLLVSTRVVAQIADVERARVGDSWAADPSLVAALRVRAQQVAAGKLREAVFLGSDFEARENPHANSAILRDISGAAIIDNESHIAAEFACQRGVPFVAVRAVSDSVDKPLPPAALIALDAHGKPNIAAIAKSLLRHPGQIRALIRTAREYKKALHAMAWFRREIGFVQLGSDQ
jgi:adenosylhomocysteine nucleosidase